MTNPQAKRERGGKPVKVGRYGEPWGYCGHKRGGCVCLQIWSKGLDVFIASVRDDRDPAAKAEGVPVFTHEMAKRVVRRIVACVNACRGVSTEDLEDAADPKLRRQIAEARADYLRTGGIPADEFIKRKRAWEKRSLRGKPQLFKAEARPHPKGRSGK